MMFAFLSSVFAAVIALLLLFFFSFSIWDCANIVGPLLVLLGITREFWLLLKRLPKNSPDEIEAKKHKQEVWAVLVVMAGVAVELIVVPHSLNETSELKLKTEELRQANDALELQMQPRRITEAQKRAIIRELRGRYTPAAGDKVIVQSESYDAESRIFAMQIAQSLAATGVHVVLDNNSVIAERPLDFGVKYLYKGPPNAAVKAIAQSLKQADILPAEVDDHWENKDFIMEIWVAAKPLTEEKNSN